MELLNHTQFDVRQWITLNAAGHAQGNILIKGAFKITADEQGSFQLHPDAQAIEIHGQDQFFGEPNQSSVRVESDFNPIKPSTDITANATAFAPHGKAHISWLAGIQLADHPPVMVKVFGPRHWHRFALVPVMSLSEPCLSVPLRFENAFGGSYKKQDQPQGSPFNPVGCGLWPACRAKQDPRAHQVEWPDQLIHEINGRHPQPAAGFGIRHRSWQPRLALAGSYDAQWIRAGKHQYPKDYHPAHHFAGCEQLRPKHYLNGGERLTFYHLTPESPQASLQLPHYRLIWQLTQQDSTCTRAACMLESVHLEIEQGLDQGYVMLSWRGLWPVVEGAQQLSAIQLAAEQR